MQPGDDTEGDDKMKAAVGEFHRMDVRLPQLHRRPQAALGDAASRQLQHLGRRIHGSDPEPAPCQVDREEACPTPNLEDSAVPGKPEPPDHLERRLLTILEDNARHVASLVEIVPVTGGGTEMCPHLACLPKLVRAATPERAAGTHRRPHLIYAAADAIAAKRLLSTWSSA